MDDKVITFRSVKKQISPYYDSRRRNQLCAKRVSIYRTLSIGMGYQAQTVVRTLIDRYFRQ